MILRTRESHTFTIGYSSTELSPRPAVDNGIQKALKWAENGLQKQRERTDIKKSSYYDTEKVIFFLRGNRELVDPLVHSDEVYPFHATPKYWQQKLWYMKERGGPKSHMSDHMTPFTCIYVHTYTYMEGHMLQI